VVANKETLINICSVLCNPGAESEGEEANEEECEDPCWLISSTTKPKPQPHQINPSATKSTSPQGSQQHREKGGQAVVLQNGGHQSSKGKDDVEKNLHSAVRNCVNPDTFNDILRLAGQNSSNGGNGRNLWRKGSLDSADSGGGEISGSQARKSSAPDHSVPVVLRFLIRRGPSTI
jgi:hypothetical protein